MHTNFHCIQIDNLRLSNWQIIINQHFKQMIPSYLSIELALGIVHVILRISRMMLTMEWVVMSPLPIMDTLCSIAIVRIPKLLVCQSERYRQTIAQSRSANLSSNKYKLIG